MSDEVRGIVLDALCAGPNHYFPEVAERLATLAHGRFGDGEVLDEVGLLFREGYLTWGSSLRGIAFGGGSQSTSPFMRVTARGAELLRSHQLRRERERRAGQEKAWKKSQVHLAKAAAK